MSNQRTGFLEVPGFKGILGIREDGAVLEAGGIQHTLPSSTSTLARTDAAQTFTGTQTFTGNVITTANVGTVTTAATTVAEEHGDGFYHITKLTLTNFAVGTGDDNANLAIGAQVYAFPASGAIMVMDGSISGIFDQTSHGTISGGEVGLGTTTGTGAAATLSSTMENIFDGGNGGVLSSYVLGTTVVNAGGTAGGSAGTLKIATGGTKSVFLNIAAAWPNIAAPEAVKFTGVITIRWRIIS